MDKVLIVDGNEESLNALRKGFETIRQFKALFASNGKDAIEILEKESISVFVTDMNTPEIDGVELLVYMTRKHPTTPCILMTDYGKPWFRKAMDQEDVLYHVEKPVDPGTLASAIFVGLNLADEGESLKGMSLFSFLPVVELEQKTCRLEISGGRDKKGYLYFLRGDLIDAHCKKLSAERAALEIIGWDNISLKLSDLPRRRSTKRIKTSLMDLVGATWDKLESNKSSFRKRLEDAALEKKKEEAGDDETTPRKLSDYQKTFENALDTLAPVLKAIKGYEAVGILDADGAILASNLMNEDIDLKDLADGFIEVLFQAQNTAVEKSLGGCHDLIIHTAENVVLVSKVDVFRSAAAYVIGRVTAEGSWYYMKIQINDMMSKLIKTLNDSVG